MRSKSEMAFVMIGGPAGIGKTRLLDELERLAAAQQIPTLRGAVAGVEHSLPYASICRIIEESLRLPNPPDLSDLAPELTQRFPLLLETPELRVHARGAPPELPADRLSVFDLLARAFIRIAASQHVVIAVEDLQFGDISVEALEHIAKRLTTTPLLLIGSYRTEEIDRAHPVASLVDACRRSRHGTPIELGPLTMEGTGSWSRRSSAAIGSTRKW